MPPLSMRTYLTYTHVARVWKELMTKLHANWHCYSGGSKYMNQLSRKWNSCLVCVPQNSSSSEVRRLKRWLLWPHNEATKSGTYMYMYIITIM